MKNSVAIRVVRVLSTLLVAVAVIGPGAAAIAANIQTDLFVYQNGDTVTITGDGFGATETIDILTTDPNAAVVDEGIADTDDLGNFAYQFVLNATVPGLYDVVGTGRTSGVSATTQFDPPTLVVSPTSWSFGSVNVGASGTAKTFTITNNGTTANTVTIATSDGTNFSVNPGTIIQIDGTNKAPNNTATFTANFTPQSAGSKSATLTITCQTSCNTVTATLNGTGLATDGTPPLISKTVTGAAGANGWYTSSVSIGWAVSDPESVVVIDSGCGTQNFTAETTGTTSSCTAHSAGGSSNDSVSLKIDKTGPTANSSVSAGTLGLNGWYTSDVTVHTSGTETIATPVSCTDDQQQTTETSGQVVNGSCTNDAGLTTNAGPLTVKLDKTAPQISAAFAPAKNADGWNNSASVVVSYTCTDNLSLIDTSYNTPPSVSGCPNTDTATAQGITTFNNRTTRDMAGNIASVSPSVHIDRDAPTISQGTIDGTTGNNGWYTTDVTVHFTAFDSLSDLKHSGDADFTLTAFGEGSSVATGTKDVFDKADNKATAGPLTFMIDKHAPAITCDSADGDWHDANASIHCTALDSTSGLADAADASFYLSTTVPTDTYDVDASTGTHQVCDAAGNCAAAGPIGDNKIDRTLPTVVCDAQPTGWQPGNVSIGCSASDTGSGIGGSSDTLLWTNVADGSEDPSGFTGSHDFFDLAGNQATAGPLGPVMIDRKAPQLSSCDAPDGTWHDDNATLTCTYTDGGSGPSIQDVSLSTTVGNGFEDADAAATAGASQACDAVGNCAASPADIGGNQVDRKGPQLSSCQSPDGTWHLDNVTLTCAYTDGGSGPSIQDVSLSTTVGNGFEDADAAATAGASQACDAVGNCAASPADIAGNQVDRKAPTVVCGAADALWHGGDVAIACLASDDGSGLKDSGDASFNLATSVDNETDDSNASTDSRTVLDNVDNSFTVGPVSDNKVDKKKPAITCGIPVTTWQGNDAVVHCAATDGTGSGLLNSGDASFDLNTTVAPGTETDAASTNSHEVCDQVAHCATAGPFSGLKVDKRPPQLSSCDAPDGTWHDDNVTLTCTYTDGGSGPSIQDVSLSTTVGNGFEDADAAATAGASQACDAVGNCAPSPADIAGNQIDRKGPQPSSCDAPDGTWHEDNVTLTCTYTDGGSGPSIQDVSLSTTVGNGFEDADAAASAGTDQACDAVGNCAASPADIGGNQIDRKAPTVTCAATDGVWHAGDVGRLCVAADGGSGIAGSDTAILNTNVPAGDETSNAMTGTHTFYDVAGNSVQAGPLGGNKVDKKAPTVGCGSADGAWHSNDVSIHCAASDGGSGLADSVDATFSLSTNVPPGTETSSASTGSRSVADAVGNSATAGPIAGNKVDKKAPVISITTPAANAIYTLAQPMAASYGCTDGGSGSGTCLGTVPNLTNIDTASVGPKTFTVNATDAVGNTSVLSVGYTVSFKPGTCNGEPGHQVLQPINADGSSVFKKGSTIPVKFRVCDANGTSISTNVFDPDHAAAPIFVGVSSGTGAVDEQVYSTTPDDAFRWDPTAKQWIFNQNTKNLLVGKTYTYWIYLADGSHIEYKFGTK
jgi:hypothetical protein